ncbi:MAG: HlyD family efflux transporter periplasmic adaptor subunit, partial [Rubritepida sp.]|nr:HlyD family efflux transporter periplasmic adaptor subunit [Rubritepida sp.]
AWPAGTPADPLLLAAARLANSEGRGVLETPAAGQPAPTRLAHPVRVGGRVAGAAALEIAPGQPIEPRRAMRELQWALGWAQAHAARREEAALRRGAERGAMALELIAAALEAERFADAARTAVTELAVRLDCERVSLGLLRRGEVRVAAISHAAQFGKRMSLVRLLGAAMDEAVDQRTAVLFPAPEEEPVATRAHAALAAAHGAGHVLTLPLLVRDAHVGALTLERPAGRPFDQKTVDLADAVGAILGPALLDKKRNDRWLVVTAWDAVLAEAKRLLGPGHPGRKLGLAALIAAGLFAQFATGTYRVVANGQLEGVMRRAIAAPFDGFLAEAGVKAGDTVQAGDTLAWMDRRDLALERLRWATERQQHATEYDRALAARQRAEAQRFRNQLDQAEANLRLVDEQLARARIAAPFAGLVVSGDLTQQLGAPLRRGETLFELAPLDRWRVELRVPESQIADVAVGQRGTLVLAALPGESLPFTIERVTPVAEAHEGRTHFAVDARLDEGGPRLRPGMQGVGKIEIGERRLVWIWTRALQHWARLVLWRWWP